MADPYRILGIDRNSTDEEIKTAYKNLAIKYHPDSYVNNPLADLASQKMAEIDEAYDRVMQDRRGSSTDNVHQTITDNKSTINQDENFQTIRNLISNGRISEAEQALNNIGMDFRNGEWNFLMGSLTYSKGWLDESFKYFNEAIRLEPTNQEYRSAYNRIMWQRNGGTTGSTFSRGYTNSGCSVCDACSALLCADCCCECMGGNLLPC